MKRRTVTVIIMALGIGGASLMSAQKKKLTGEEVAVRDLVLGRMAERDKHTAANLDWENAFGIRIHGLAEKQRLMSERVGPTRTKASEVIEKVTLNVLSKQVAVGDKYWKLTGQTQPGYRSRAAGSNRPNYLRPPKGQRPVEDRA